MEKKLILKKKVVKSDLLLTPLPYDQNWLKKGVGPLKAHSPRHDLHFFLGKVALLISWSSPLFLLPLDHPSVDSLLQ